MQQPVSKKTEEDKGMPFKQIVLTLLYVSLGLVALASIGLIMFGVDSDYGGSAMGTVALIILTDVTILLALVARHDWLKYSSWASSFLGFLFVGISIWIPRRDYMENARREYITYVDPNDGIREVIGDIGWSFYLITFSLLIVGVLSLLYKRAMETNKIGRFAYWVALGAFPLGTLPAAFCLALQIESNANFPLQWRFYLSMLILSITAFMVLLIALFSQILSVKRELAQHPNMVPGGSRVPHGMGHPQPQQFQGHPQQGYPGAQYPGAHPQGQPQHGNLPPHPQHGQGQGQPQPHNPGYRGQFHAPAEQPQTYPQGSQGNPYPQQGQTEQQPPMNRPHVNPQEPYVPGQETGETNPIPQPYTEDDKRLW